MNIAVLVKVGPDYEVPASDFQLEGDKAHSRYKRMMGLYDENALEVAIQLKERSGASVRVLSQGSGEDVQHLRKALAMGGEELHLVEGPPDEAGALAASLSRVIRDMADVDLVLCGRQSSDQDRGLVGGLIAGLLGWPYIANVSAIEAKDREGHLILDQVSASGRRKLKAAGPVVVSITSDQTNVPRIPPVRQIFAAKKKPVNRLEPVKGAELEVRRLEMWVPRLESDCSFLEGDDPLDLARELLNRLKGDRLL